MNTPIDSSALLERHASASNCKSGDRNSLCSTPVDGRFGPHAGPLPQLIAMRDVIAWWTRENWLARGGR